MKTALLLKLMILAALPALAACESMNMIPAGALPSIKSVAPRITGIDLSGVSLAFDVGVDNPLPAPIKTPKFDYTLSLAGEPFASQTAAAGVDLPARGIGTAVLPVHMKYAEVWRAAQKLRDATEIPYQLDGRLLFNAIGRDFALPLKTSGTAPVLRMPQFSGFAPETPNITGSQARVGLAMDVANPNAFALGLQDLGYELRLGDLQVGSVSARSPSELGAGESQRVVLSGVVSGLGAIQSLIGGSRLGAPTVKGVGSIMTPYGAVKAP